MLTNFELNRDSYWRLLTLMCVTAMVFIVANSAFASGATSIAASNDTIGLTMCRLTSILSGGVAKSIATIAIFTVGIGLFMGKFNWGTALMTAVGVLIVFSGSTFINMITGGTAGSLCSVAGS